MTFPLSSFWSRFNRTIWSWLKGASVLVPEKTKNCRQICRDRASRWLFYSSIVIIMLFVMITIIIIIMIIIQILTDLKTQGQEVTEIYLFIHSYHNVCYNNDYWYHHCYYSNLAKFAETGPGGEYSIHPLLYLYCLL